MHTFTFITVLCLTFVFTLASPLFSTDLAARYPLNITFGPYATTACLMQFGPGPQPPTASLDLVRGKCVNSPYTFYSYWIYGTPETFNKTCQVKMFEEKGCKGTAGFVEQRVPSIFVGCVIPNQALVGNSVKMVC